MVDCPLAPSGFNPYKVPTGSNESRLTIRGSRFIGFCAPAGDEPGALGIIRQRSGVHRNATHHCWALRIGLGGEPVIRCSDAGEPTGTAGKPILDQILKNDISNAVLVVSRWFGGTKLGKGGLARAYGQCAAVTLAGVPVRIHHPEVRYIVHCAYDLTGLVEGVAAKHGGRVESGDYAGEVNLKLVLPYQAGELFTRELVERSAGRVEITAIQS